MKEYLVKVIIKGYVRYEDPKCPSYWKGSGVYDIDKDVMVNAELSVIAESEKRAREIVEAYPFDLELDFGYYGHEIDSCELVRDVEDDEEYVEVVGVTGDDFSEFYPYDYD